MIKRLMILLLILIALFAILPFLSVLAASGIASGLGCALDEGSTHVCMVAGIDIGGALYTMFVLLWLSMLSIPLAGISLIVWLAAASILYILHRRRRAA
ncbi:MAG TPA: hypothetical protein VIJ78_01720 [Pseudolabrys sp.]